MAEQTQETQKLEIWGKNTICLLLGGIQAVNQILSLTHPQNVLKKIHKMLSYSPFIHIRINLRESISFKHVPINCSFIRSHIHLETLTSTILPQTFTQHAFTVLPHEYTQQNAHIHNYTFDTPTKCARIHTKITTKCSYIHRETLFHNFSSHLPTNCQLNIRFHQFTSHIFVYVRKFQVFSLNVTTLLTQKT